MRLHDLPEALEERDLDYPLTCDEAVDAVGMITLESPEGTEETVAEALSLETSETFHDAQELYEAVAANVDESFVGRREYDDRGPNVGEGDEEAF